VVAGLRFRAEQYCQSSPAQSSSATADFWAKIIAELGAGQRFDTVNLVPEQESSEQLRLFAAEVMPRARAVTP
jgi:hypothetical protein